MTAEARFRWERQYRKPVTAILVGGSALMIVGLLTGGPDGWVVLLCGVAAWAGCFMLRLLASDGGSR